MPPGVRLEPAPFVCASPHACARVPLWIAQGTSDQSSLLGRREEARLERVRNKGKQELFD